MKIDVFQNSLKVFFSILCISFLVVFSNITKAQEEPALTEMSFGLLADFEKAAAEREITETTMTEINAEKETKDFLHLLFYGQNESPYQTIQENTALGFTLEPLKFQASSDFDIFFFLEAEMTKSHPFSIDKEERQVPANRSEGPAIRVSQPIDCEYDPSVGGLQPGVDCGPFSLNITMVGFLEEEQVYVKIPKQITIRATDTYDEPCPNIVHNSKEEAVFDKDSNITTGTSVWIMQFEDKEKNRNLTWRITNTDIFRMEGKEVLIDKPNVAFFDPYTGPDRIDVAIELSSDDASCTPDTTTLIVKMEKSEPEDDGDNEGGTLAEIYPTTYKIEENLPAESLVGIPQYNVPSGTVAKFSFSESEIEQTDETSIFGIDNFGTITIVGADKLDHEELKKDEKNWEILEGDMEDLEYILPVWMHVFDTPDSETPRSKVSADMTIIVQDIFDEGDAEFSFDSFEYGGYFVGQIDENPSKDNKIQTKNGNNLKIGPKENPEDDPFEWRLDSPLFSVLPHKDGKSANITVINPKAPLFDHEKMPNDAALSVTLTDKFGKEYRVGVRVKIKNVDDGAVQSTLDSYDDVFGQGDININDIDTECMLDLLNDRLGINMGTPFSLLGEGLGAVGDGLEWAGVGGAGDAMGKYVQDPLQGFGKNLSDIDINDMGLDDLMNIINPGNKPVFDGPGIRRGARIVRCNIDRGVSTEKDLRVLMIGWVNFALLFVGLIAVIALIYAGFLYILTGSGDGSEKAKKIILYVVAGILLILGSYAIVNTLISAPQRGAGDEIIDLNTTPDPYMGAGQSGNGQKGFQIANANSGGFSANEDEGGQSGEFDKQDEFSGNESNAEENGNNNTDNESSGGGSSSEQDQGSGQGSSEEGNDDSSAGENSEENDEDDQNEDPLRLEVTSNVIGKQILDSNQNKEFKIEPKSCQDVYKMRILRGGESLQAVGKGGQNEHDKFVSFRKRFPRKDYSWIDNEAVREESERLSKEYSEVVYVVNPDEQYIDNNGFRYDYVYRNNLELHMEKCVKGAIANDTVHIYITAGGEILSVNIPFSEL